MDKARHRGGDDLAQEHGARRHLHVVAKLEIGHEAERLRHGDVAKRLEEHEAEGAARLDVAVDELGQHVEANLRVGDGLDDANGQRKRVGDEYGQQERPPGKVGRVRDGGVEAGGEHDQEERQVPPVGRLGVLAHELHVDVGLLRRGVAVLLPYRLAAVDPRVHQQRRDGGKREAVCEGKGGADEERRVLLVGGHVEGEVGREDARRVVLLTAVVVGARVAHGEVRRVPDAAVVQHGGERDEEDDDADEGICNGVPRRNERRADVAGDLGPVKGDGQDGETRHAAKELVDDGVLRRKPRREGKHAEKAGQEARYKVVKKGTGGYEGEPPKPWHRAAEDFAVRLVGRLVHGV